MTVRLTEELAEWLKTTARKSGRPISQLIRDELERAKRENGNKAFLRHAGAISGPPDLSSRKGYSKK